MYHLRLRHAWLVLVGLATSMFVFIDATPAVADTWTTQWYLLRATLDSSTSNQINTTRLSEVIWSVHARGAGIRRLVYDTTSTAPAHVYILEKKGCFRPVLLAHAVVEPETQACWAENILWAVTEKNALVVASFLSQTLEAAVFDNDTIPLWRTGPRMLDYQWGPLDDQACITADSDGRTVVVFTVRHGETGWMMRWDARSGVAFLREWKPGYTFVCTKHRVFLRDASGDVYATDASLKPALLLHVRAHDWAGKTVSMCAHDQAAYFSDAKHPAITRRLADEFAQVLDGTKTQLTTPLPSAHSCASNPAYTVWVDGVGANPVLVRAADGAEVAYTTRGDWIWERLDHLRVLDANAKIASHASTAAFVTGANRGHLRVHPHPQYRRDRPCRRPILAGL